MSCSLRQNRQDSRIINLAKHSFFLSLARHATSLEGFSHILGSLYQSQPKSSSNTEFGQCRGLWRSLASSGIRVAFRWKWSRGSSIRSSGVMWNNPNLTTQVFLADPLDIPDLPIALLSHLKILPPSVDIDTLQTTGSTTVASLADSPEPTYIHHPSVYCHSLCQSPPVLPWLFDLDRSALIEKETAKPQGLEWDWERFVRRIAQDALFQSAISIKGVPLGLQNRRRIWKLLEDWRDVEFGMEETKVVG